MGFFPVYPFIGFAEGADILLDVLHKVKDLATLMVAGVETDRAEFTYLCKGSIEGRRF